MMRDKLYLINRELKIKIGTNIFKEENYFWFYWELILIVNSYF